MLDGDKGWYLRGKGTCLADCLFSVGSGYALAVNSQWNRIRGRRDDHSNRNWMLIGIGIGIGIGNGIDNRCSELGLGFTQKRALIRPFEPDGAPGAI
jgi:hypothetical protein